MTLEIGSRSILLPLLLSACLAGFILGARSGELTLTCNAMETQLLAGTNNLALTPLL